jgi:hypothetical protein
MVDHCPQQKKHRDGLPSDPVAAARSQYDVVLKVEIGPRMVLKDLDHD